MSRHDEEFISHLTDTIKLMFQPFVLKYYLLLTLPTLIIFKIDSGIIFGIFCVVVCLFGRSAKLGGLLGWFIVSLTIFVFYNAPEANNFIEYLLRAPARASSNEITPEQVINSIPVSTSSKLFWSLVFGLRGGFVIGAGLGLLGRKMWGYHPKLAHRWAST